MQRSTPKAFGAVWWQAFNVQWQQKRRTPNIQRRILNPESLSLKITVDYLADHPGLIDRLARLSWEEWQPIYQERGQTFEDALNNYRERTNTDRLPLTLVALDGEELVGTVSLKFHDLDTRPNLDPWLGALFVVPDWRRRGVASLLMHRAVDVAVRLKLPQLFLWTSSAEGLYLKLGWQVIERTTYGGKNVVIMRIDVASATK